MGMRKLESELVAEARVLFNNPKLRVKDMLEWSTGPVEAAAGEVSAQLQPPSKYAGIMIAISATHDKRPKES